MPCDTKLFRDFYHNGHMYFALEDSNLVLAYCSVAAFGFAASCPK